MRIFNLCFFLCALGFRQKRLNGSVYLWAFQSWHWILWAFETVRCVITVSSDPLVWFVLFVGGKGLSVLRWDGTSATLSYTQNRGSKGLDIATEDSAQTLNYVWDFLTLGPP